MSTYDSSLAPLFRQILAGREAELRVTLGRSQVAEPGAVDAQHDVADFKDRALEESFSVVDDAKAEQAAHELEQVMAARRRLDENSYGQCLDCGEMIDLRRLTALPAAPYCTNCQAIHEQQHPALRRRATLHLSKGTAS